MKKTAMLSVLAILIFSIAVNYYYLLPPVKVIHFYAEPDPSGFLNDAILQYEDAHPNVKIKYVPLSLEQLSTASMDALISGDQPVDVFSTQYNVLPHFVYANKVEVLNSYLKEKDDAVFLENASNAVSFQNRIYGLPYSVDTSLLLYNKLLMQQYGFNPPQNGVEMVVQAKSIIHSTQGIDGFSTYWGSPEDMTLSFLEFYRNFGGHLENGQSLMKLDYEETNQAFSYLHNLFHREDIAHVEHLKDSKQVIWKSLLDNQTLFAKLKASDLLRLSGGVSFDHRSVGFRGLLPGEDDGNANGLLTGQAYVLSKYSKVKKESFDFMLFLTSQKMCQDRFQADHLIPAHLKAFESLTYSSIMEDQLLFKKCLVNAVNCPKMSEFEPFSKTVSESLHLVLKDEMAPNQAVQNVLEQVQLLSK